MKQFLARHSRITHAVLFLVLCFCSFQVFAQTLPAQPATPAGLQRIKFTSIKASVNTGQDYSPWLNDDLTSLVQNDWDNNFVWVNITLKLAQHSIISRFSFYDYEGVFTDAPASIYASNNGVLTLLGTFTGPNYMVFDDLILKAPVEADDIVIRKYSNNIPQKIYIYGVPDPDRTPISAVYSDASLSNLSLTGASLSPKFSSATMSYNVSVGANTASTQITPTPTSAAATVSVAGTKVQLGSATTAKLVAGNNVIKTVVTAADGKTQKTYIINVNKALSTDANLSKLTISAGTLTPAFSTATTTYTASVSGSQSTINIVPTAEYGNAAITINGKAVKSGTTVTSSTLVTGLNVGKIVVTAEDGKTTKTYTLNLKKALSNDATLSKLSLSAGTLSPAFSSGTTSYTTSVGSAQTSVQINPTVNFSTAKVAVNGTAVKSGSNSANNLLPNSTNVEKVVVTAADGVTTKTYQVTVNKASASDAYLAKLALSTGTLSPAFSKTTTAYKVAVGNGTSSVVVTPSAEDLSAGITVNGKTVASGSSSSSIALAVGNTTITTVVKSKNGLFSKSYSVVITRAQAPIVVVPPIVTPPITTPPITVTPPTTPVIPPVLTGSNPLPDTGGIVKIPIDSTRWYMLNNVSNGLGALTDGNLTGLVNTGYGFIFQNYDAYYPIKPGERVDLYGLRFYGDLTQTLGAFPLTVSVIDSTGVRTVIGTYIGGVYKAWVGPTPGSTSATLTKPMKNVKYIVLNCWYQFPPEMELYGYYRAPDAIPALVKKTYPLNQYFGVNAFEWNIEDPTDPFEISPSLLGAMKSFTQIRHYMDWNKLESTQGEYTYAPVHSGGWNYDAMYQSCQANNIFVLADLKCMPDWMKAAWPADQQDSENVPVPYGSDYSDPNSYILQAKVAFQYAARYGSNSAVSSSLLSVDPTTRWTGDPANVVKKGTALIQYIECDNERDKWWKGRRAYQTAYEYAANMSAFYDGNKNTMGPGVGVKNADPNMKVVMGGIASADPAYVHAMIEWCKQHRGYNADGTVNLCWDIINYHFYSNNSIPEGYITIGVAPELSRTAKVARAFVEMSHEYAQDMPVWVTEAGYDANQGSIQRAPAIGNKTPLQVEADWILRTSLLYAREGIQRLFYYEEYDDNAANPTQYASSGLINADKTRRPAADYLYQANKLFGNATYVKTTNSDPVVDNYALGNQQMYAVFIPDQVGRTSSYTLDLNGADSAYVFNPVIGANDMTYTKVKTNSGKVTLTATETPQFVVPSGTDLTTLAKTLRVKSVTENAFNAAINMYPNPTNNFVTVALNNKDQSNVTIKVMDVNMGRVYGTYSGEKAGDNFAKTIDVSAVPKGVFIVQVMQGGQATMRKVIKNF